MFTDLIDDDWDDETELESFQHDDSDNWCKHGSSYAECDECDAEYGDIDKCLNCGRYRASSSLNRDQCCKAGCVNPDEY